MLKPWTKVLPLIFIEWYIRKYGETFYSLENKVYREYNAPYPFIRFYKGGL